MHPGILKRFIILMLMLTAFSVIGTDVWRRYAQRPPGDFNTQLGSQRLEDGRYDQALEFFDQALAESPNHRGALMGRAIVYIKTGQWAPAIAELDHLVEFLESTLEDDDTTGRGVLAAAYANRGIAHDYAGEHEKALEDYIESLQVDRKTVGGPGVIHKILYDTDNLSTVRERAVYLYEQFQLPESQRLLRVPELDAQQRMYKP